MSEPPVIATRRSTSTTPDGPWLTSNGRGFSDEGMYVTCEGWYSYNNIEVINVYLKVITTTVLYIQLYMYNS